MVYGYARVYGDAVVYGTARVSITPPRVSRSDGHDFILVQCDNGEIRVIAGCRCFTFEEAYRHWNEDYKMYDETIDILDYLKKRAEKLYVNSKSD
jgi:hypothetical protein